MATAPSGAGQGSAGLPQASEKLAFGAPVGLMERLAPGEGYDGAKRERGFFEVETDGVRRAHQNTDSRYNCGRRSVIGWGQPWAER